MSVQVDTIWISQNAIHFWEWSLLNIVPMKGSKKQVRNTSGDNKITRNIYIIYYIIDGDVLWDILIYVMMIYMNLLLIN